MGLEVLFETALFAWGFLWPSVILARRFLHGGRIRSVLSHLIVFAVLNCGCQAVELVIGTSTALIVLKWAVVKLLMQSDFRGSRIVFGWLCDRVEDHRSLVYFATQANLSVWTLLASLWSDD
jgi:hypothetical protein